MGGGVFLVGLRGAEIPYGDNPVPRRGELVEFYALADAQKMGGATWRVRDVAYIVQEDTVKVLVYLDTRTRENV